MVQCSVMAAHVADVIVQSDSSDLEGEDEEVSMVSYCSLNSN